MAQGVKDLVSLLWAQATAVVQVLSLAQKLLHAAGVAKKKKKKRERESLRQITIALIAEAANEVFFGHASGM